jgi:uncharacterized protein YdhG (YjbR/CyaY superfamily)
MAPTPDSGRASVEAYLAALSPPMQQVLEHLRSVIRKAAPDAEEAMVYGGPGFRLNGGLVGYAAHTAHCALYPLNPALIETFTADLAPFRTSKGAIQFTPDAPLPDDLVTRIVLARVAENSAKAGKMH